MAKNSVAVQEETRDQLPEELRGFISEHAGEGTSQSAEDNLIPLIYVLQTNSPQVNKRDPNYIEGAQPGDFWLRGTSRIWSGSEGLPFQSCHFRKNVVEWIPRDAGGGIVGQHDTMPSTAKQVPSPKNPDKMVWVNDRGDHEFVETRYHAGYALGEDGQSIPCVIPLSSTGNTVSRNWMNLMNTFRVGGKPAPSYSRAYRLKTVQRTNKLGTWFTIKVEDLGWLPLEQVQSGKRLYDQFVAGEKRAEDIDDQVVDDDSI